MREIKLRAWGGNAETYSLEERKMVPVGNIMLSGDDEDWGYFQDTEGISPTGIIKLYEKYGWVLLEFTGLLDKNGVQIFEGDIVDWKIPSGKKRTGVVVFSVDDSKFCIVVKGGNGKLHYHGISKAMRKDGEVIGDIYHNPELLNEKQNGVTTSSKNSRSPRKDNRSRPMQYRL